MRINKIVLYFVFIINLIFTSIYIALDLMGVKIIDKLDFTFLIIYDIISLVILTEFVFKKDKKSKR